MNTYHQQLVINYHVFWHQIWITLLDKGLLALMLAFITYQAARFLETYKADLAVQNEEAKRQVDAVANVWATVNQFDMYASLFVDTRTKQALLANAIKKKQEEINDTAEVIRNATQELTSSANPTQDQVDFLRTRITQDAVLLKNTGESLNSEAATRNKMAEDQVDNIIQLSQNILVVLANNRFWIGDNMYIAMWEHFNTVASALLTTSSVEEYITIVTKSQTETKKIYKTYSRITPRNRIQ